MPHERAQRLCLSAARHGGQRGAGQRQRFPNGGGHNSDGYWEAEFKTYADGNGHFCLASTGLSVGARVSWQHCGANGTVWILEPHNNGAYLVSRYALDHGHLLVLTANGTARFTQLTVNSEYGPGSIYWQTWTFS